MATDNLTKQLQEEFARRGKIVSESQINKILQKRGVSPQVASPRTPTAGRSSNIDWEQIRQKSGGGTGRGRDTTTALGALGSTLWSFADTAGFGLPGIASREILGVDPAQEFTVDEDLNKWLTGFGGFAGFVAGAPMKVGAKILQKAAAPFIAKAGRQSVSSVVKGMKQIGKQGGLSNKAIKTQTKSYEALVKRSQLDTPLRGENFKKAVTDHADKMIERGIADGTLKSLDEAAALRKMFEGNALKRPLQDFQGLTAMAYGTGRLGRFTGHLINDAVMFAAIDGIFEGVTMIEDGEFDWTAPLWGAGNGAMFSTLSLLKPKGKAASWFKDFKVGVLGAFSKKSPYKDLTTQQLGARVKFMGDAIEQNGGKGAASGVRISYGGVDGVLNLNAGGASVSAEFSANKIVKEFQRVFGDNADKAMKKFLDGQRKHWGKQLMKWSSLEEVENLASVWPRMLMGGALFNAHTFYEMYAHDMDADVHDILPHFLIGAYMQRSHNANKFDLNSIRMNRVRANMATLGFHPQQLNFIPSLMDTENEFRNPLHQKKFDKLKQIAEKEGIISDDNAVIEQRLGTTEDSVGMRRNPMFEEIWRLLRGTKGYIKPTDQISTKSAEKIVKEWNKVEPTIDKVSKMEKYQDETSLELTKDFETRFPIIVKNIQAADTNGELKITDTRGEKAGTEILRVPTQIGLSKEIYNKAEAGELSWLGVDSQTGKIYEGQRAVDQLINKVDGFNAIVQTTRLLGGAKGNVKGKGDVVTLKGEQLIREVYETVRREESNVNEQFKNNSYHVDNFTFRDHQSDYISILQRNHAIRFSRGVVDIFKENYTNKDALKSHLRESGILVQEGNELRLIDDLNQVKIEGAEAEEVASLKRFLGRVLSIQSVSSAEYKASEQRITVSKDGIIGLREFLNKNGYNEDKVPNWLHDNIVNLAMRDRIQGTDLKMRDIDAVFRLSSLGMAKVGVETANKSVGFRIRLIDPRIVSAAAEGQLPSFIEGDIAEYNRIANELIKKSNGLIVAEGEPIKVIDGEMINLMYDAIKTTEKFEAGTQTTGIKLAEFIQIIGESPGSARQQEQMGIFIEGSVKNEQMLARWLTEAGVLEQSKSSREIDINMEKYNAEVKERIEQKINVYGVDPAYAERMYAEREQTARDLRSLTSDESNYVKSMTMQEYFGKYRPDGQDYSVLSSLEQRAKIDELIFESKQERLLTVDSVNQLIERTHVDIDGVWTRIGDLSVDTQYDYRKSLTRDLVGLLSGRRGQIMIPKISWKNGRLKLDSETVQFTRMDAFFKGVDVPYMIFDPYVPVYMYSSDGRRVERRMVDIFGKTENLSKRNQKVIEDFRLEFERIANRAMEIDGMPIRGESGELGFTVMRLAPGMSPIGIKNSSFKSEVFKEQFKQFAEIYGASDSGIERSVRTEIRRLSEVLDGPTAVTNVDYESMLRFLMNRDMLTGVDGDALYKKFLNGDADVNVAKLMGRGKLYHSKKFIKVNREYVDDVAQAYSSLGDIETTNTLLARKSKNGWDVAVWDDAMNADVKSEVDRVVRDMGIDWSWGDNIGGAHRGVSGFDSIAFVNADVMKFGHTMLGHNPNSKNPFKPVISSGGENSSLLLGKTLFVYSPRLEPFFGANQSVDILLTGSGAKAINPVPEGNIKDRTLITSSWEALPSARVRSDQIRRITLESLGLKPERDYSENTGTISQADYNYYNNSESTRAYESDYQSRVNKNIDKWKEISKDKVSLRQWVLDEFGDAGLAAMTDGESTGHLNGLFFFSSISRDANPMSYSEGIVKNKMYQKYIDSIVNESRSVTNQNDSQNSHKYGGQGYLIQTSVAGERLKPTLVDKNGDMKLRGEVMLPNYEQNMTVRELMERGFEMRIVENTRDYTWEQIISELYKPEIESGLIDAKSIWNGYMQSDFTLGLLHQEIQRWNSEFNRNLQIGVVVNRKPRTRPNDMALMGLKGFLPEEYGNGLMINSMDVVNVFEGDYDADKADYFFAHRGHMYDHVKRTSHHFIQGVDPSSLMRSPDFHWGLNSTEQKKAIEKMAADLDLYNSSIGQVQKIPRKLGYLGKLGNPLGINLPEVKNLVRTNAKGETIAPKLLFEGENYKIVMDYENRDFLTRSALETQYIIDGSGNLNKNIANDIHSWADSFLFPRIGESITPGEVTNSDVVNNIRTSGSTKDGKRVRIFRRIDKVDGEWVERQDLSSLDKGIVKTLLHEYGRFLNATGDSMYGNAGEQRRPTYQDVIDASERFSLFNGNLSNSVYYRLKNRRIDPNVENSPKWWTQKEFKDLFGTSEPAYTVKGQDGKEKRVFAPTKTIFDNTVVENGKEFSRGERGAPIERIFNEVYRSNIFDETRHHQLTGEGREIMDTWYNELVGGNVEDISRAADVLTNNVMKKSFDINKKVNLVASLKKKIVQISRNKYQPYKTRKVSIDKLNDLIKTLEKELGNHIEQKYWKTRKSSDLKRIKFVNVDSDNMRKGTIYYATMEQMKKFLPLLGGSDNWGLSPKGRKDLKLIKNIRGMFYGNNDTLKDVLKYGKTSLLDSVQIDYLKNSVGEMSTFYEIEGNLLQKGMRDHGMKFLWAFMQPAHNKYQIGVMDGRPISVPYEAKEGYDPSSRYRRGLNLLTQMARGEGNLGTIADYGTETTMLAKQALGLLQFTEAQFSRYFNREVDMKGLIGERVGEYVDIGELMGAGAGGDVGKRLILDNIRLPNFNKDFERSFGDYGSIKWNRGANRIGGGSNLMNDHLLDFYGQIMRAAGKEKEFDSYLNKMNDLQAATIENRIMNPIDYLSMRLQMDKEVREIAQEVLSRGLAEGRGSAEEVNNIMRNPVFAIMGGTSFFKGLTLERQGKYSLERLSDMKRLSNRIERVRKELPVKESTQEELMKLRNEAERIKVECAI